MRILHTSPVKDGFFMPAEFAPHDGCLMIWPERTDSWQLKEQRERPTTR